MKKWLFLVVVAAFAVAATKMTKICKKSEWQGLSESELRLKIDTKLPAHLSDEKRSMISDKIVAKMQSKGVLGDEPTVDEDETVDLSESISETV